MGQRGLTWFWSYLVQQQGQELDDLVGRQGLQVGLLEAAQVLVFGLKGDTC